MPKVFGVAPPQTLYHTRHVPSPSVPSVVDISALHHQRNPNRSAYMKNKVKRPGSSESSQGLLSKGSNTARDSAAIWSALITKSGRRSEVYSHYQHSLNSLHDILDRVCSAARLFTFFLKKVSDRMTRPVWLNCISISMGVITHRLHRLHPLLLSFSFLQ